MITHEFVEEKVRDALGHEYTKEGCLDKLNGGIEVKQMLTIFNGDLVSIVILYCPALMEYCCDWDYISLASLNTK